MNRTPAAEVEPACLIHDVSGEDVPGWEMAECTCTKGVTDLTPETLAELRRLLDDMRRLALREGVYNGNMAVLDIIERVEPLLDAAARMAEVEAERDALAAKVEAMQSTDGLSIMFGMLVHEVGEHTCGGYGPESNYIHEPGCGFEPILDLSKMEGWPGAERDALAAKVERVRTLHFGEYVEDEDRNRCFECGDDYPCPTIRAMLAGRCLSDITHRDDEHRQSVCMLPVGHAPLAHDDCVGCTWTDADHWQPSAVDRVADEVARIADESQHEDWDSPRVRSIVGRIRRAIDGTETDYGSPEYGEGR